MLKTALTICLCLLAVLARGDDTVSTLFQNVCAQCHGPKGEGKDELKTPSIAHLPHWYVVRQLSNFHDGKRGGNPRGVTGDIRHAEPLHELGQAIGQLEDYRIVECSARTV